MNLPPPAGSALAEPPVLGDAGGPQTGPCSRDADQRLHRPDPPRRANSLLDRGDLPVIRQCRDQAARLGGRQRSFRIRRNRRCEAGPLRQQSTMLHPRCPTCEHGRFGRIHVRFPAARPKLDRARWKRKHDRTGIRRALRCAASVRGSPVRSRAACGIADRHRPRLVAAAVRP